MPPHKFGERMTRANNLERVWKKLGIVILSILGVMSVVMNYAGDARILSMMFIAGNLGGYCAIHRSLFDYSDDDLAQLSQSWFALILPPLIGGILSMVLYGLNKTGMFIFAAASEQGADIDYEAAREVVYKMPYSELEREAPASCH